MSQLAYQLPTGGPSGRGIYSKTRRAPAFRRGLTPKRLADNQGCFLCHLVVLETTLPTWFPNPAMTGFSAPTEAMLLPWTAHLGCLVKRLSRPGTGN